MPLSSRDTNIPRKPPPAQSQPASHSHSKLPRRVVTPSSTPPTTTTPWIGRIAERIASTERSASETRNPTRGESVVIRAHQKARDRTPPVTDKPLPGDKPLPSRPILRLSSALSPSKDSRGLIDAAEAPLHITSIAGERREWPALRPQTSRSPSISPTPTPTSMSESNPAKEDLPATQLPSSTTPPDMTTIETPPFMTARTSRQGHKGKTDSHSPASSYASAIERSSSVHESSDSQLNLARSRLSGAMANCDQQDAPGKQRFPARQSSLDTQMTLRKFASTPKTSRYRAADLADSVKNDPASATPSESRAHSPSPASFSQPRRSSRSLSSMSTRTANTASRIPIPDSKKPTIIDVKGSRVSASSSAKLSLAPSFGSRRLASPEALKILENGKLRRQLKRIPNNDNTVSPLLERTNTSNSGSSFSSTTDTPSLSYSPGTSPECTLVPNSPSNDGHNSLPSDEYRAISPSHEPACDFDGQSHGRSPDTEFCRHQSYNKDANMFDDDIPLFIRAPPPTSPFTGFLQTIPSEAALPIEDNGRSDETRSELTRTLSHLEGKGSPPKSSVDPQTLQHLFGHLKRGLGSSSTAFAENAAAAEKYLALGQGSDGNPGHKTISNEERRHSRILVDTEGRAAAPASAHNNNNSKKHTIASKWSESTPSDKGLSPLADGLHTSNEASTTQRRRSNYLTTSIGYPSRIPARAGITQDQSTPGESAIIPDVARRRSSPTLGKPKPGSVRAARERLYGGSASFARMTASADSKKTGKRPTTRNRALNSADVSQRGRVSSAEQSRPKTEVTVPKTPRSRSKSRYVLDKINGLFSGKKEKKTDDVPPMPRMNEAAAVSNPKDVEISSDGSPTLKATRTPTLPKMPSLSLPSHATLRSTSRATVQTDDSTMIDSVTVKDEPQSVHALSEHLISKAQRETNPQRKERLLSFAKVLNDSLINAREAQISAETAQHAARCAQLSYEMTQKSLSMLQKLASSVTRNSSHTKR